jgi:thiamine biosynthesis lipoprotein
MKTRLLRIVGILLFSSVLIMLLRRCNDKELKEFYFQGFTMGKIQYNIKYLNEQEIPDLPASTDSLLVAFNQSLSTYIKNSEISRFNATDEEFVFESDFFYPVLEKSLQVHRASEESFDPTVMPLVNFWGFGPSKAQNFDSSQVKILLERIGFEKHIRFDKKSVRKARKDIELDFSAIAKGYAVDMVAAHLLQKGLKNYMVEIGGEAVCRGINGKKQVWKMGITNPNYKNQGEKRSLATLELKDRAMATSGNYEKFYIRDGKRYAHTINPKTGFPVEHNLLSATVLAEDCMTADAWATAFMVLGVEKAKEIQSKQKDLEMMLVYDSLGQTQTFLSKGFQLLD